MQNVKQLPDMSESLAIMNLGIEIDAIHGNSIFIECLRANVPVREKVKMIWEQIQDNPDLVYAMIGRKVYEGVVNYYNRYQ